MQSITIKYFPATNTKPARVQAVTSSGLRGRIAAPEHSKLLARELAEGLGWKGRWFEGTTLKGEAIYVCADPHRVDEFYV